MAPRGIRHWLISALVIGALTPALTLAQVAAARSDAAELPRVLPVWSNDSGRVEALLLIDQQPLPIAQSPLDRLLSPSVDSPRLGVATRLSLSRSVDLRLGLDTTSTPAMALLCDGNLGLALALGRLNEQCLLTRLSSEVGNDMDMLQSALGVSAGWHSPSGTLDFSFGLSWLNSRIDRGPLAAPLIPGGLINDNALLHPALAGELQLDAHELVMQGSSWLGPRSWMRVEGRRSSNRLSGIDASSFGLPLGWDNTSLRVSGGYRRFSGSITGRLIELDHPRQSWTDVDLDFSWRTPWDARVSVGARNLLGGPDREQWPLSNLPGLPATESRTPYVRYHQDL